MRIEGVWVPVVTPLRDGRPDLASLRRLSEHLLGEGAAGLVACGSTGEASLLEPDEQADVVGTVAQVAGEATIAGVVAASTVAASRLSAAAAGAGARSLLVLVPGLAGGSQEELAGHIAAVADATSLPVLVYEFPARTAVKLHTDVLLTLAGNVRVVGTKQSVPVIDDELQRLIIEAPDGFAVAVGNARLLWPALALGAAGGILAAANLEAKALCEIDRLARDGDLEGARAAHQTLSPRLAAATGIAKLKRALCDQGLIASAEVRAPLRPA